MTEPATFNGDVRSARRGAAIAGGISLIAFVFAMVSLLVYSNIIGAITGFIFFAVFGFTGLTVVGAVLRPLRLTIDQTGITSSARGHTTRLRWEHVTEVRIIQRPRDTKKGWLSAWLEPGVERPQPHMYLPEWKNELAGVRVCDLDLLSAPLESIREAVREAAGSRWNGSSEIR